MVAQLELIPRSQNKPGCNVSLSDCADTWAVNLRLSDSEKYPFVYCDKCSRLSCYRRKYSIL
jgi:hypothetical protein